MFFQKIWDKFLTTLRDELDIESHVVGLDESVASFNRKELEAQEAESLTPIDKVISQEA
jgi:xanthine dehydrogenase molybdopterin-binding subunit B